MTQDICDKCRRAGGLEQLLTLIHLTQLTVHGSVDQLEGKREERPTSLCKISNVWILRRFTVTDGQGMANGDRLAEAQETIARQAREIERLRRQLADERFAEELREFITVAAAAGTIASPLSHSRLLEMIVETAAHVISARAA